MIAAKTPWSTSEVYSLGLFPVRGPDGVSFIKYSTRKTLVADLSPVEARAWLDGYKEARITEAFNAGKTAAQTN